MSLNDKIETALNNIGRYYVQELKRKIIEDDRVASGELLNSITPNVVRDTLTITANKYLEAISEGKKSTNKNPSPEMTSRVSKWMRFKGLKPKNSRSLSDTAYKKAAFAIARGINRSSWQGSGLIKKSFYAIEENIDSEIAEAFKSEIEEIINNINKTQK